MTGLIDYTRYVALPQHQRDQLETMIRNHGYTLDQIQSMKINWLGTHATYTLFKLKDGHRYLDGDDVATYQERLRI